MCSLSRTIVCVFIICCPALLKGQTLRQTGIVTKDTESVKPVNMSATRHKNPSEKFTLKDSVWFFDYKPVYINGTVQSAITFTAENETTEPVLAEISPELEAYLQAQPEFRYWTGTERGKTLIRVRVKKVRKLSNGTFEKRAKYSLSHNAIVNRPKRSEAGERAFAANSLLAPGSGYWYKLGVVKDGVYKITYTFLQSIGINPDTVNPQRINIFGNSYGQLPDANATWRPDDLLKNAIYIEGEGDGNFGPNDYILFYAKGPNKWTYNSGSGYFTHKNHHYSDTSYYFINVSAGQSPKRIAAATLSGNSPTHTVTKFSDYHAHENDLQNFIKSGYEWYGEEFDVVTSANFGANFPNLDVTDTAAYVTASMVSFTPANNVSSFTVSIVGTSSSMNVPITGVGTGQYLPAAIAGTAQFAFTPPSTSGVNVKIDYNKFSPTSKGWLNYIELNVRRNLVFTTPQLLFRDPKSVGVGNTAQFNVSSVLPTLVFWDVTHPSNVKSLAATFGAGTYSFTMDSDTLREYAAFLPSSLNTPFAIRAVTQQDLHGLPYADMLLVTAPDFLAQANELAEFHESEGLSVHVVNTWQIYNEFSSGMRDAGAIRAFARMFYERANGNSSLMPKYLLLFGDGSYDNKNRFSANTAFIPTYQSVYSLSVTSSYTSDDYFGLLDSTESFLNSDLLDIGIGRIVCRTTTEAQDMVNKVKSYSINTPTQEGGNICGTGTDGNMGPWRNKVVLIADDEDGGPYVNASENQLYPTITANAPQLDIKKIYLDSYTQTTTPGGQRYYDVERLFKEEVQKGALVVNYMGHGGEVGLAHERILDVPTIQEWTNSPRLAVFMTATCEFSRFDDPGRTSAGEFILLNRIGGGIALFTTTRLVYQGANENLNVGFFQYVFDKNGNQPKALGEVCLLSKNLLSPGDMANARNFCLLGDPAVSLRMPRNAVVTDSINGTHVSIFTDTLKALSFVTITGHVEDGSGGVLNNFNGTVFPTVYDKVKNLSTLGQDAGSPIVPFEEWQSIVFKGKATVVNGYFTYSFVIPRDLNPAMGTGRISYYVHNNVDDDGHGFTDNFNIGDINTNAALDNLGPDIRLFMNGESFVDGGTTDEDPLLIAKFEDANGINTVGTGIGHDITCVLDNNTVNTLVLNDYYEAENNTFQKGGVNFPLSSLEDGAHTVKVKVWDTYNNSSEKVLDFVVADDANVALEHVLNYPNPFTTNTAFYFEHNQMCSTLDVSIDVLTISGKVVKSIRQQVFDECYRIGPINWDGRDDFGDKLARGTYIYRVKVRNEDGQVAEKIEKLVILF